MQKLIITAVVLCACVAHAQAPLQYRLSYAASGDSSVQVCLKLPSPRPAPVTLVIPRNYPGGYDLVVYDSFVENVHAFSAQGKPLAVQRAPFGPRWILGSPGEQVARVEYSADVVRMEKEVLAAVETSKVRPHYLGLLGYSVFAYIDGLEDQKISL